MLQLATYDASDNPYSVGDWEVQPAVPLNQEGRILAALGKHRGALPHVSTTWLARYYDYLVRSLVFPFEARCPEESGPLRPWTAVVSVVELLLPIALTQVSDAGLVCRALRGNASVDVPLIDLEIEPGHANAQLIEDYWYWFWNWRFDPGI